jgi:hypothetical protein
MPLCKNRWMLAVVVEAAATVKAKKEKVYKEGMTDR